LRAGRFNGIAEYEEPKFKTSAHLKLQRFFCFFFALQALLFLQEVQI